MDYWQNRQVEQVDVNQLLPYAQNARIHNEFQVGQIARSIQAFGWTVPILIDERGTIIAGHGRVLAAMKLDMANVPAIRLIGLSDNEKSALTLADNKIALNAGYDNEMLQAELTELAQDGYEALTGFSAEEFAELCLGAGDDQPEESKPPEKKAQWVVCPHCGESLDAKKADTPD